MDINTSMLLIAVAISASIALCSWARQWGKVKIARLNNQPAPEQKAHHNG